MACPCCCMLRGDGRREDSREPEALATRLPDLCRFPRGRDRRRGAFVGTALESRAQPPQVRGGGRSGQQVDCREPDSENKMIKDAGSGHAPWLARGGCRVEIRLRRG
jgi:hypothetical protein